MLGSVPVRTKVLPEKLRPAAAGSDFSARTWTPCGPAVNWAITSRLCPCERNFFKPSISSGPIPSSTRGSGASPRLFRAAFSFWIRFFFSAMSPQSASSSRSSRPKCLARIFATSSPTPGIPTAKMKRATGGLFDFSTPGTAARDLEGDHLGERVCRQLLVGKRKPQRRRYEAEQSLIGEMVELVDHPIDRVRQLVPFFAHPPVEAEQTGQSPCRGALGRHGQALVGDPVQDFAVALERGAAGIAQPVGKEAQRPLGGDLRVELPDGTRGGVSGVGEFLFG